MPRQRFREDLYVNLFPKLTAQHVCVRAHTWARIGGSQFLLRYGNNNMRYLRIIWTEHDHVREWKNLWSSIYFDFVASSLKFKFADRSIIIGSSFWLLGFFLLLVVNSHTSIIPQSRVYNILNWLEHYLRTIK